MAYGINNGILDRGTYLPVVEKGWAGLIAHIYQDGRMGCIQPVGAAPGAYTVDIDYVFGTGAFFWPVSEVDRLASRCSAGVPAGIEVHEVRFIAL